MDQNAAPELHSEEWFRQRSDDELRALCNGDPSSTAHLGAFAEQERRDRDHAARASFWETLLLFFRSFFFR